MDIITIEGRDVRVGDKIYDAAHYAPDKWLAVREIEDQGREIKLVTLYFATVVHKGEGIAVQRQEHSQKYTIADIRAANKAAGFHFFDRDSMQAFSSRIESSAYSGPKGIYFVTSEQVGEIFPRLYSIRRFNPTTGRIAVPDADRYSDVESARQKARQYTKTGAPL